MRKLNNKGLSLVELLIAVCIIGIIVTPLFKSFVSSYRVNSLSKQTLRATTLAQNEMEFFEKESLQDICDPDVYGFSASRPDGYEILTQPNPADVNDKGCYSFVRRGIINDESGREMFDVYISLDPLREDSSSRYYTANTTPLLVMNTISNKDSGTYVQTVRTESNAVDQDTIAYSYFQANQNPIYTYTTEQFKKELKRTITVTITQTEVGGMDYTKATVSYLYKHENPYVMPVDKRTYTPSPTVIYDNTGSLDAEGNPIALKSVYLFYAPRYEMNAGYTDDIVVRNESGLPVDIYIVRQDLLQEGGSTVRPTPMNYMASLTIYDVITAGKTAGVYHTNLNVNEAVAEGSGQQIQLELHNATSPVAMSYSRNEIIQAAGLKALEYVQAKDRIYEMEVKVYKAGETPGDAGVKAYATLTGTKLE